MNLDELNKKKETILKITSTHPSLITAIHGLAEACKHVVDDEDLADDTITDVINSLGRVIKILRYVQGTLNADANGSNASNVDSTE